MNKLLQINTVINTGSTGRIAEGIGQSAKNQGWESYIAYGRYGNKSQSQVIKIGTKWDNYTHVIKTRLTDKHGLGSKNATKQFVQQIKEIKPDIIHLHNIHGYYLNYEILFGFLAQKNIPIVWTLHDCWSFTGHCTHFEFVGCDKWESKRGCHHCPETGSYPKSYVDNSPENYSRKKKAFTSLEKLTLVPVSQWLAEKVKRSFLQEYPTCQIYTGLDLSVFKPMETDKEVYLRYNLNAKNKIYLGVASTWTERKGLEDYKKLTTRLNSDEIIVLIGLTKVQISSLPKNIVGIERTENVQELIALYTASEALLNLTFEDTFPTVNIEALACGTPVITYATGGSPEAIDEQTGWVVQKGDLEGVRKAMDECKLKERESLRNNCRQRAEKYFDKKDRFQEYINLYDELINPKG